MLPAFLIITRAVLNILLAMTVDRLVKGKKVMYSCWWSSISQLWSVTCNDLLPDTSEHTPS